MSIKTLPPSLIEAVKNVLKKSGQHPYVKTNNDENKSEKNEKETNEKETDERESESMKDKKKKEC